MSSILLPFVAKVTQGRALIAPNLRYCSARGPIKEGCAAIVRAGRGDGDPILYNLAAHHQEFASKEQQLEQEPVPTIPDLNSANQDDIDSLLQGEPTDSSKELTPDTSHSLPKSDLKAMPESIQSSLNKDNAADKSTLNTQQEPNSIPKRVRTITSLTAEQRNILTLSTLERKSFNDFVNHITQELYKKAAILAKDMIAFAGMQALKSFLPKNAEEYLLQTNNGTKGIDLVIFDQLNPLYVVYICSKLYEHQNEHFKELCSLYPQLSQVKAHRALKGDGQRVAALIELISQNSSAFAQNFDCFDSVHIAIPKHIVRELKPSLAKKAFIDQEHKAIYWRDNNLDSGQLILSSIDSSDDQASMKNVRRIRDEQLVISLLDHFQEFINLHYQSYGLTRYELSKKDPLVTTLKLLHQNSEFSLSLELIATYAALCLMHYSQDNNMLKALGSALSALHWPCQSNLFNTPNLKSVEERRFNTVLNNKAASCQCYGRGFDVLGENLNSAVLIDNFNDNFTWDNKKLNANQDSSELIALEPWESGAIKQYLKQLHVESFDDQYHKSFNLICFIEWQNRLQKLFISDPSKKAPSKPLSVQTMEHFASERKGPSDDLSEDEVDVIYLCDKPSNLISTPERTMLYDFYQSKRHVFALAPALDRQWKLIIYAQERYDHENFLLSLGQAILYVQNRAELNSKLERIELNLPLSLNELSKLNSYTLRSFAIYFGRALLNLQERSGGLFVFTFAGAQESDSAHPLVNFINYSKEHQLKICSATSKKANTLKFNLTAYYQDNTKSETLELSWSLLNDHIAHNMSKDLVSFGMSQSLQYAVYERTIDPDSALLPSLALNNISSFNFTPDERTSQIFSKHPKEQCNLSTLIKHVYDSGLEQLQDQSHSELLAKWQNLDVLLKNFTAHYVKCLYEFLGSKLQLSAVTELAKHYSYVQAELLSEPLSTNELIKDKSRQLLELLLMIGMAYEDNPLSSSFDEYLSIEPNDEFNFINSSYLSALATPLCVESLRSLVAKNERLVELMSSLIKGKIELNNQNLFIEHLTLDINYADNPEQNMRFNRALSNYEVLIAKENCLGYTLYESTKAHKERFTNAHTQIKAKGKGTNKKEQQLSFLEQEYLTEVSNYIENYLKSRPYLMEQCTIMVYYCTCAPLILALYHELENNKSLSKFKFNLVIVNHHFSESQEIYELFEQEKRQKHKTKSDSSYLQRVAVSVLTDDRAIDNNALSKFSSYLNAQTLNAEGNLPELGRVSDICLLFHVFDNHAHYGFTNNNVCVPIVLNEREYQPSLINYAHYQGIQGNTTKAGKYLVCPVMGITRAQLFHSYYYLIERHHELFAAQKDKMVALLSQFNNPAATSSKSLVPFVGVPLFEQTLDDSKHSPDSVVISELLAQVQQRSDMVVYFDDLMCRHMLQSNNIDVVYYNKLRNYALNFMVASTSSDLNSMYHLKELLEQFGHTDLPQACAQIRHDAITISGSVLLHAQSKRINVYEMMGLVLSKYLGTFVFRELASLLQAKSILKEPTFISLDDYAAIFGKKQQLRADIVGLQLYQRQESSSLHKNEHSYVLALVILESKFFQNPNDKAAAKSLSQTQSSTENFYAALQQKAGTINGDRQVWLSRLADMLINNAQVLPKEQLFNVSNEALIQIQELIRRGQVDIILKGVSCVYACSDEDMTFDKASKSGRLLGPGVNKSHVTTQLVASKNNKGKYPVMQIKIYKDALAHLMKLYLSGDQEHSISYLAKSDSNNLITSYLTKVMFLSSATTDQSQGLKQKSIASPNDALSADALNTNETAPTITPAHEEPDLDKSLEQGKILDALDPKSAANPDDALSADTLNTNEAALSSAIAPQETEVDKSLEQGEILDALDPKSAANPDDALSAGALNTEGSAPTITPAHEEPDLDKSLEQGKILDALDPKSAASPDDTLSAGALNTEEAAPSSAIAPQETEVDKSVEQGEIFDNFGKREQSLYNSWTQELKENIVGADSLDKEDPFASDLLMENQAVTATISAMPNLAHAPIKSLPPRFTSFEERTKKVIEEPKMEESKSNPELEDFYLEHPRLYKLIQECSEQIDFNNAETLQFVKNNEQNLITGLKKSGLRPVLKNSKITANGAIFSFEGNDNFEISKIKRISDKLLTTYGVDICNIRGKSREIDIYIKADKRIKVPYFALLGERQFNYDYYEVEQQRYRGYNSKFILGLGEESGQVVYLDLRQEQPHTLIAGSTGSGKSVLINCLILDMAITNLPQELELILVDPKMGAEFGIFEDLPHLKQQGIITDKDQALEKLKELTELMDKRYLEIQDFGRFMKEQSSSMRSYVRNIDDYNKYCCAYQRGRMGRIFFIMDEFADWFADKDFRVDATEYIQRLAQKARATGIHVILATQRPDAKIMDSNIKSQLGNRIALKTTDRTNSQIILDDKDLDASALSGKGHMICKLSTVNYAQSGFVSDEMIYEIIDAICQDYQERLAISN